MLPEAVPTARILTYDWNGDFDRTASNDLFAGHADTLLSWTHDNRMQAVRGKALATTDPLFTMLTLLVLVA